MNNIIGKIVRMTILTVASLYAVPVLAQAAPAGSGSTGNFPVITVPPPPMTSVANQPTPGADSTLWSNGIPGPQSSSVTIPLPPSGGGGRGGGGGGGLVCAPGQTQACASNACPPNYTGTVPTSMTCVSPGTWPTTCTPTVAMIDANPTAYGCTPTVCTPGTTPVTQTANCPNGYTTLAGATTFTQTATQTTTCPGNVITTGAWSPSAASACPVYIGSGGTTSCSVQCPVQCRLTGIVGGYRTWNQEWASGGGSGCPVGYTGISCAASGSSGSACPGTMQCSGDKTYTYTSTSSCPTGSGNSGCTLAQVNAGTCATCSRTCGSTESGLATCQTHNITATTCSYWSYSGSSCPAGATGGTWRAGLCP